MKQNRKEKKSAEALHFEPRALRPEKILKISSICSPRWLSWQESAVPKQLLLWRTPWWPQNCRGLMCIDDHSKEFDDEELNIVGKTIMNHPFGNSFNNLFVVIWASVYYFFTPIIDKIINIINPEHEWTWRRLWGSEVSSKQVLHFDGDAETKNLGKLGESTVELSDEWPRKIHHSNPPFFKPHIELIWISSWVVYPKILPQ